jgi:hypothetical protein
MGLEFIDGFKYVFRFLQDIVGSLKHGKVFIFLSITLNQYD